MLDSVESVGYTNGVFRPSSLNLRCLHFAAFAKANVGDDSTSAGLPRRSLGRLAFQAVAKCALAHDTTAHTSSVGRKTFFVWQNTEVRKRASTCKTTQRRSRASPLVFKAG